MLKCFFLSYKQMLEGFFCGRKGKMHFMGEVVLLLLVSVLLLLLLFPYTV